MHDWLFANQNTWANAKDAADQFRKQAVVFGVDGGIRCVSEGRQDRGGDPTRHAEPTQFGVRGTPAFFLQKLDAQGKPASTKNISGALPFDQFDQTIKALMN